MFNVLDRVSSQISLYSTPIGQIWYLVIFIFRMFIVAVVGSTVYSDEQGNFRCDTNQPGCQNVCFNREGAFLS